MSATLLLLLLAAPEVPLVYVAPSSVTATAAFTQNLALELEPGRLVSSSTAATHRVQLHSDASDLLISVERDGHLVLARTIPNDDPIAARRVAVLLIVRAVQSRTPDTAFETPKRAPRIEAPVPIEEAPIEEGPPHVLTIAPQLLALGWSRPAAVPQLGLQVDLAYLRDGLGGGVSLAVAGGLCCSRSTADVDGSAVELHALVEGRVPFATVGSVRLGVDAGIGVTGYFLSVRPVFEDSTSPGTQIHERALELVFRGGLGARIPIGDGWAIVGRAALRVSILSQAVLRPAVVGTEEPLGPGRLGPWLSVGAEWALF